MAKAKTSTQLLQQQLDTLEAKKLIMQLKAERLQQGIDVYERQIEQLRAQLSQ